MENGKNQVVRCGWLMIWTYLCTVACAERVRQHASLKMPDNASSWTGPQGQHFPQMQRSQVFMVIIVTSPVHLPRRREWQRRQWQKSLELLSSESIPSSVDFVYKFCIGKQNLSNIYMPQLDAEQRQFGDLQFVDSLDYDHKPFQDIGPFEKSATTTKVLAAIKWAVKTYTFKYFLRLGDDAYIRPEAFLRQFNEGLLPTTLACICFVVPAITYNTPAGEVKAPYPSGMGFALTYDVSAWLSLSESMLMWGAPEDGMVGLWFAGTRVRLHHHDGFRDINWRCEGEDLLVHILRDQEAWDTIDSQGNIPCGDKLRPFR